MSIFGAIYALIWGVAKFTNEIKDVSGEIKRRDAAETEGSPVYGDRRGLLRRVDNNKPCNFPHLDKNGDKIIDDWDGNVVRNFDKPERLRKVSEAKAKYNYTNLIGCVADVCPELLKNEKWKHVYRDTCVFYMKDPLDEKKYIGRKFLREKVFCPELFTEEGYFYFDIKTREIIPFPFDNKTLNKELAEYKRKWEGWSYIFPVTRWGKFDRV